MPKGLLSDKIIFQPLGFFLIMGKKNIDKICFSKVRHATKQEAEQHADYLWETEGIDLKVYKCPICNGYHLSSKKG